MKTLSLAAVATEPFASEDATASVMDEVETSPFEAVAPPLRKALEERGFDDMTVVQRAVLAGTALGRDLQISSQTGSGKTVALGLVLAPRLLEAAKAGKASKEMRSLRALVIVPTRELAVQVSGELEWLFAEVPGLTVECVTGGSSVGQERRRLERKPTVVVGTPGRLLDHIRTRALDCTSVAELVLDEADRMLDMGFREELEAILDATPAGRSTHLVSATFPPEIQKLARKYQTEPLAVQGTRLGVANEDIEHVGHLVRLHDRYAAIVNLILLTEDERTLIFVNTRAQAAELADQLASDGFAAAPISGELEQNQRTRTLEAFRSGMTTVLVATDVAARGLDIPDVALVIHTDAPFDSESYTHRAGRTGRAGCKGRSVILSTPMRQRKVEFLLSRAKVKLQWREVPTAATVEKALAKRERRRLREALEAAAEPTAAQIAFAEKLLDGTEPAQLIARLVEFCRDPRHAAACDIEPLSSAPARPDRAGWHDRPDARGARRPDGRSEARSEGGDEGRSPARQLAERFEMNWGHRGGATPQRVLAVLCRRGNVSSRAIGAIDIDNEMTSFEVACDVARDFEHNADQPDDRDPRLVIRRARGARSERPQRRRD
ncbi:MAG: DEAD/DEAH box helicase [Candidatus Binatia bacterium]